MRKRLSSEFFVRLFGAVVGAVFAGYLGVRVAVYLGLNSEFVIYVLTFGLLGFLIGLILTPVFITRPLGYARRRIERMPAERLVAIIGGVFLGLIATSLLTLPLSMLPNPFRQIVPLIAVVVLCYLSIIVLSLRQNDLRSGLRFLQSSRPAQNVEAAAEESVLLLDTSVIIDGRISDICKTGFIRATLLVPNFVLLELQHIADSADPLRRNRGRRGMDVLKFLQEDCPVPIRFSEMDVSEVREVDSKLVALARELTCPIMTNDYNLNRIAELQGVTVLNINDLANAVKSVFLPGEELAVKIVQVGREVGQGVAYLDDGTMVVVEDGKDHLNDTTGVVVTKVLQTAAGRMIFARPQMVLVPDEK
ncbi:MAG TPA: PIN domain-containing protein [candidate division Zixibacteria bacterium]|nr:PIN domain-containing protein [candidate division Zixibacteria bacterium]